MSNNAHSLLTPSLSVCVSFIYSQRTSNPARFAAVPATIPLQTTTRNRFPAAQTFPPPHSFHKKTKTEEAYQKEAKKGEKQETKFNTPTNRKPMPTQHMSSQNGINKVNRTKPSPSSPRSRKMPLSRRNPALALKISQMRLTIAPIVHVESGLPGPDYPATMLSLFLLTEAQLDALAAYYSQSSPSHLSLQYPCTMDWQHPFLDTSDALAPDCKLDPLERLKVKMRMFARFIGMRGADTPRWEYERQIEILANKIRTSVRAEAEADDEDETALRKFSWTGTGGSRF